MFTLTWITAEKELERVTENKGDEFRRKKNMEIQSGGEKMRILESTILLVLAVLRMLVT